MHTWIDYETQNYCSVCNEILSKEIFSCPDCNKKLRTRPRKRYRSKEDREAYSRTMSMEKQQFQ